MTEPMTHDRFEDTHREISPTIWRCAICGALIHPSSEETPAAWCSRCGRVTEGVRDGG